jgi:methyl-accepting chemotaxis protein
MQLNIKEMLINQEPFGQGICLFITLLFLIFMAADIIRMLWFQKLNRCLIRKKESPEEEPGSFEHEYLQNVYDQYVAAKQENANAADLDSMLDKEIPVSMRISKNIISLFPGLMTALGLLGTFYGLSAAIIRLITEFNQHFVFSNSGMTMQSFKDLVDILRSPLVSMSTAFTTSLLGLFMSILANLVHSLLFSHNEEKTFACIVDFFENEIGIKYESGLDRAIIKLKDGLQESINKFSGNVQNLSLNLEFSAETIDRSVSELNQAIDGLHGPIEHFRGSIEIFSDSCSTLDEQVEAVNMITARLSEELGQTLHQGLKEFVGRMEQVTEQFTDKLDKASSAFSDAMVIAVNNMYELIGGMNDNLAASTDSNREMKEALSSLTSIYKNYEKSTDSVQQVMDNSYRLLLDLQGNIRDLSINVSNRMREAFDDAVTTTMNESAVRLADHLRQETEQMNRAVSETNNMLLELRENLNGSLHGLGMRLTEFVDTMQQGNADSQEFFIQTLDEMTNKAAASYDDFHRNIIDLHETADLLQKALNYVIGIQTQTQSAEGGQTFDDI